MPKKDKLVGKKSGQEKQQKKVRWRFVTMAVMMAAMQMVLPNFDSADASSCPDVKVIFARGSGGERYTSGHYLAFKAAMEEKLATSELTYEIDDLDYSAVSIDVGDGHLGTLLGAYVSGGDAYEFGDSVHEGTDELLRAINNSGCTNTKYVLAGYSQGAIVLLNGLDRIDPDKIIYVATFGDPKIYLPEGAGLVPVACSGKNLSEYRVYVPDCRAHKGILGARDPYVLEGFLGKVGTWCNKRDILCSSHFSISDHTSYAEDGLYEDASRFIFSKIGETFGFSNQYTSPHDTAILIDSTGSMSNLIEKYKAEALNLAEKTLSSGGRVALYDYRDLNDGYTPVERCNFETCDLESFQAGLEAIGASGGGDTPESLLSASLHVMQSLNWNFGSTKSLVILTDAGYHSPDLDGTTFYDVQKLSKQIDPVNFYIITEIYELENYRELAEATGGMVASSVEDLSILTETIMEKYESLPRVEEEFMDETYDSDLPEVKVNNVEMISETEVKISFEKSGEMVAVFLNDGLIGTTYENEITIGELRNGVKNTVKLAPLTSMRRGETVAVELGVLEGYGGVSDSGVSSDMASKSTVSSGAIDGAMTLKVPNTGRR
ncbi:cutinase family protein [Candidatus Saccharibacteria bacterium]|nr:cutinase family protein [Candidatus Saccharibacteria bacterium]